MFVSQVPEFLDVPVTLLSKVAKLGELPQVYEAQLSGVGNVCEFLATAVAVAVLLFQSLTLWFRRQVKARCGGQCGSPAYGPHEIQKR